MSCCDERFAEAFDVHRAARREVLEPALQLRRTRDVLAAPHRFLFLAMQLAAASRARRTASPTARSRPAVCVSTGTDDARDDVAGLLDDHPVALADVLARDVVGVVERGHRDGRAADEDRLEHRERRHRSRCGRR